MLRQKFRRKGAAHAAARAASAGSLAQIIRDPRTTSTRSCPQMATAGLD